MFRRFAPRRTSVIRIGIVLAALAAVVCDLGGSSVEPALAASTLAPPHSALVSALQQKEDAKQVIRPAFATKVKAKAVVTTTTVKRASSTTTTTVARASVTTSTTTTTTVAPRQGTTGTTPAGLYVSGGKLMLAGQPYYDLGVNAYELATDWGVNDGCGADLSDAQMNSFFASLPVHTLVRFWAWQGTMAVNVKTGQIDWAPLDRVFTAAAAHGDLLLVSLTSQGGDCDDNHWKDPAWYGGGYDKTYGANANGTVLPLSYLQYVQAIVTRYRTSPALGMWEPVNEPEASTCPSAMTGANCSGHQTCPSETQAAQSLRKFFDTIGSDIHALDPTGLIEAGFLGAGQCGTAGTDYSTVGASQGIDVLTYHDYYSAATAMGGDQWNGIAVREAQAKSLNKPIVSGEMGIVGGSPVSSSGCLSEPTRESDMAAKIRQQSQLGTQVFLFWNWVPPPTDNCTYDIGNGDPTMSLLGAFTPGSA